MKKIIASKLNKYIDIYDFNMNVKDNGSQNLQYSYLISVFASMKPIEGVYSSFKYYDIKQLFENNLYIFTIRAGIALKPKMIIKHEQNNFEIKKLIEDEEIIKIVSSKLQEENVTFQTKSSNL